MLKAKLIADAEIIASGYERYYIKDKEEAIDDSVVKMNLVTPDYKVSQVMKFVEFNNPNEAK